MPINFIELFVLNEKRTKTQPHDPSRDSREMHVHNVNNHDNSYKGFHDEGKFEKLSDVIKLSLLGVDL